MLKIGKRTVLALVLGLFLGCKSDEPKDYFGDIATDLTKLQAELKDGIYQVDSVTKSLNRFATIEGDLRPGLSDLQQSVGALDTTTTRIQNLGDEVRAGEASFQSSWSEDIEAIESANVRKTAEQGRSAIAASFENLQKESNALRTQYTEWESKVKQIVSSLQADLSPANQQALSAKIKEVSDLAPKLKEGIRKLSDTIASLTQTLKSAR